MELLRELKELKKHFDNISDEEFERNLLQAGYGEIEHSNESQMKIEDPDSIIYSLKEKQYQFEKLPDTTTRIYVVA